MTLPLLSIHPVVQFSAILLVFYAAYLGLPRAFILHFGQPARFNRQRHVILGPRDIMRGGARLDGLKGRVSRSGNDVPVPADLQTNIGDVVNIVRHVADMAAALGDGLRAGQFVICGSLTPPMFLDLGEQGVDFALEPIGAISVRFSA